MIQIPLQNNANQTATIILDNGFFAINLRAVNNGAQNLVLISISLNNTPLIVNQVLTSGTLILDYLYLFNGNFMLLTNDDENPDYTKFGDSQVLIYISNEELQQAIENA